jgi:hypothetical protein
MSCYLHRVRPEGAESHPELKESADFADRTVVPTYRAGTGPRRAASSSLSRGAVSLLLRGGIAMCERSGSSQPAYLVAGAFLIL